MRQIMGWARAGGLLLILTLADSACQAGEPEPVEQYRTSSDLVFAREHAGIELAETEKVPRPEFEAPGSVFQAGGGELQVFEFSTLEERQAVSRTVSADGGVVLGHEIVWPEPSHIWAVDRLIVVYVGSDGGMALALMGLLGDPVTAQKSQLEEPFPPAVVEAMRWLAAQEGAHPEQIEVLRFESVDWPDSCLGLSLAGEACLTVITPGYRVTVRLETQEYVLHTDEMGDQVRMVK